jgi:hypothetical protein
VALHAALAAAYLGAMPPFNWPDEPAHFNYVRQLSEGEGPGVMGPDVWQPSELERLKHEHFVGVDPHGPEISAIRYEAHQPPLYYAAAALVYAVLPRIEAVKAVNLLLSSLAVAVIWFAVRRLFPARASIWWGAAALAAVLPMRCFMAASIGNGVAAELVFALFALALASGARPSRVGLVIGCGLWVHSSLFLGLPLYAAWLLLRNDRGEPDGQRAARPPVRSVIVAALVAIAIWSPWLARSIELYGWSDPLALRSGALGSDEAVASAMGEARPRLGLTGASGIAAFAYLLFASFWGVFGWMEMFFGRPIQGLFVLLSLLPTAGLVSLGVDVLRRRRGVTLGALLWCASTASLFIAALVFYSLFDFQPQGRYLSTASIAFGVLYGAGLERLLGRWTPAWLVGSSALLALVNLYAVLWVVPWYLAR